MILRSIRSKLLGLVLAAIIPFVAFIGVALWVQWQDIQATAIRQTMNDARLLAAQVDDHIGNLEHLLVGLSHTVSTSAYDVSLNDALLQQVRAELPNFISNVYLLDLDGNIIGTSSIAPDRPLNVADRVYFREVLADKRPVIGGVVRSRLTREWVMPIARPVEDRTGQLRAVIVVGTKPGTFPGGIQAERIAARQHRADRQ